MRDELPGFARRKLSQSSRFTATAILVLAGLMMTSPPAEATSAPVVTKVTPAKGTTAGGTRVTVVGHRFSHVTKVKFGSVAGTHVRVVSTTKLRVTTPRHAAGVVNVRVVTSHGTSAIVAADAYRFVAPHPAAGSYTGLDTLGRYVKLFVNGPGTYIQDVSMQGVTLDCTAITAPATNLPIASIPIGSTGSFSSTTHQDGILDGQPAQFTYTFSGSFTGTTAAGQYRETVTTTGVPASTCTSHNVSWSVTRDTDQKAQLAPPPASGSYTGMDTTGHTLKFFINASGTELQDVSYPRSDLSCLVPASSAVDRVQISSIHIDPDGSFSSTTHQSGIESGHTETFTYTLRGHVHGLDKSGLWRLAGQIRESIDSTDVPATSCTTNDQSWTAVRDVQPVQPTTPPAAGLYSGFDFANEPVHFTVDATGSTLQNVSVPQVPVECIPGGLTFDSISIPSIPIDASGTFSSTTIISDVFGGHPATFTFEFKGHVHGLDPNGFPRLAGLLRESVDTTDLPTQNCTSNYRWWQATHT